MYTVWIWGNIRNGHCTSETNSNRNFQLKFCTFSFQWILQSYADSVCLCLIHFLIHLSINTQRLTQSWHLSDVEHPEDVCVYKNGSFLFLLIVNLIINESKFGIFSISSLLSCLNFSYFLLKFSYFYTIKSFIFMLSSLIYLCSRQLTEVSASMREEFLMALLHFNCWDLVWTPFGCCIIARFVMNCLLVHRPSSSQCIHDNGLPILSISWMFLFNMRWFWFASLLLMFADTETSCTKPWGCS